MSYPQTPGFVGGPNSPSGKAAKRIAKRAPSMRVKILNLLKAAKGKNPVGYTSDEIEIEQGWRHQTVSARLTELKHDGLIKDSGFRRNTRSGDTATVWVAV